MPRKVELVPYDPAWEDEYRQEVERLRPVLGSQALAFTHVGSTAIPGIFAKPIVDIMVEVPDIGRVDSLNPEMEALGYHPVGEYGIPGRRFFYLGNDLIHTIHVHVFGSGNPEIARHLDFRDYLRTHPEEAQAYSELKLKLAQKYPEDTSTYTDSKSPFIRDICERAKVWRKNRGFPIASRKTG